MKKNSRTPRGGMIAALCVVLIALWLTAVYGTYEENKREKYDVHITPGAVTYGTHSTATVPVVMTTARHAVPMVSGGAVRSYAHYGHSSMPSTTSSGKGLYATSSATVHTVGSGGGAGGEGMVSTAGTSSSRGITYGGGSLSMPTLALAAPTTSMRARATTAMAEQTYYGIGPKRAKPGTPGDPDDDGQWSDAGAGDGDWYRWDDWAGDWVTPENGDTRIEGGVTYQYVGDYPDGAWVPVGDQGDPTNPTPLGAMPWLLMMLLAGAYALHRYYILDNKSK